MGSGSPATSPNSKWVTVKNDRGELLYREDTHFMELTSHPQTSECVVYFPDFRQYVPYLGNTTEGIVTILRTGQVMVIPAHTHAM